MAVAQFSLELSGDKAVAIKVQHLSLQVNRLIANRSLRAGMKIIQGGAMRNAPVGTYQYPSQARRRTPGTTRANIKVRAGKNTPDSRAIVVGMSKAWYTGPAWYAAFLEFGHRAGKRPSSVRRRRNPGADTRPKVPGEHFIEYAYDELKQPAISEMSRVFLQELERA
jgi:HK97 gp10 family phage protein